MEKTDIHKKILYKDLKGVDLSAGMGVAIREYPTDTGRAAYILFVNREPVGVIEAKEDAVGGKITDAEGQTARGVEGCPCLTGSYLLFKIHL